MTTALKYTGTAPIWGTTIVGKPDRWYPGQTQDVSDADAALYLAAGNFQVVSPASVSGAGVIATSRAAVSTDSGGTFGLRTGATYTISDTSLIPAGVVLTAGASGGGTLAVGGSVTINGGTSSITLTARQVAAVLPTDGSATDLTVKVS